MRRIKSNSDGRCVASRRGDIGRATTPARIGRSRHCTHRLAQGEPQRGNGFFCFLTLFGESFRSGASLGEVSGQGLIPVFQVLDPVDDLGWCRAVDLGAQSELDAVLQGVALAFEFLDLFAGEREAGVQAGRRGPLGPVNSRLEQVFRSRPSATTPTAV
ncbi:hypothetical protein ACFPM3_06820, partial [Streptomyces coeruleoprunus]